MTIVSTERLANVFVELADTMVDDFDVIEFLMKVTRRTAELIGGADVGLLLADGRGQMQFMAASNEDAKRLELFQVQVDEGPCLDAFQSGQPVVNADLNDAADRWPRFAPRAAAAGYRSVHAFPLRLRQEVIGAINVFGTDEARWEDADAHIVQALAHIATIGLLQERAVRRGAVLTEQLQGALNSRIIIEQAKGAIAQFRGVTVDEAFVLLRSHARRTGGHLAVVAHAALTDPAGVPALPLGQRPVDRPSDRTPPVQRVHDSSTPKAESAHVTSATRRDQELASLLARGDLRDSAAGQRDRDAEDRSTAEAGPHAWIEREWAGRDRDASAGDRSDLIDLLKDRGHPGTEET